MDFLPRPHRPLYPCPEITLLSLKGYSGDCFKTYPEREDERWHPRKATEWEELFDNPPSDFVALIENWPLFGFMYAFFGEDLMREANFVQWKGHPPYPVLTMQDIPRLLVGVDVKTFMQNFETIQSSNNLHHCLKFKWTEDMWKPSSPSGTSLDISLHDFISTFSPQDIRSSHISVLTSILIEMHCSYIDQVLSEGPLLSHQARTLSLYTTPTMYTEFRLNGWCPADLVTNFHRFNTSCLYFLLQMSHPRSDVDHLTPLLAKAESESDLSNDFESARNPNSQAQTCTSQRCFAKVLSDEVYTTKHAYNDCSCGFVGLSSLTELSTILNKRGIPVIRSVDPGDECAKISIIEAQPDTEYIAISHVWSDGLGNPKRNAIPKCQLQRLSHLVRSVQKSFSVNEYYGKYVYFWLDTICIPPDEICQCTCCLGPNDGPCDPPCAGRRMAQAQQVSLEMMRKTYEDATAVLVLDSWLCESTYQEKSVLENLLKVFSSTWTRRLWTLQEGALAKSLHIQFLDRALDLDIAVHELQETCDQVTRLGFVSPILAAYWELRHTTQSHRVIRGHSLSLQYPLSSILGRKDMYGRDDLDCLEERILAAIEELNSHNHDPATRTARSLVTISSAVYHRSTSVPADEPLCLAALLDLNVARIAAFNSAEDRMLEFWRMFDLVPRRIIFLSEPKINAAGFRWASRSLLRSAQPTLQPSYDRRELAASVDINTEFAEVTMNGYIKIRAKGYILTTDSNTLGPPFFLSLPDINGYYYAMTEEKDASDPQNTFDLGIESRETYGTMRLAIIPEGKDLQSNGEVPLSFTGILVAIETVSEKDELYTRRLCTITCKRPDSESIVTDQSKRFAFFEERLSLLKPGESIAISGAISGIAGEAREESVWFVG